MRVQVQLRSRRLERTVQVLGCADKSMRGIAIHDTAHAYQTDQEYDVLQLRTVYSRERGPRGNADGKSGQGGGGQTLEAG